MPHADVSEKRAYDRAYGNEHREARRLRSKAWREKHPDRQREHSRRHHLRRHFALTVEEYESLLAEQGGVCAICGGAETLAGRAFCVDHDHSTGAIRGILCHRCNVCIGQASDDVDVLRRAVAYLERSVS